MSANNDLMFDGRNRVAEVAGGGRGIGRGIVWELAAWGFSVVVNFRSDAASAMECCRQAEALGAARAMEFQADVVSSLLSSSRTHLSQLAVNSALHLVRRRAADTGSSDASTGHPGQWPGPQTDNCMQEAEPISSELSELQCGSYRVLRPPCPV
ncbi:MAG: hypothetical protein ACLP53_00195 [Isosphaeraceae bacterium]